MRFSLRSLLPATLLVAVCFSFGTAFAQYRASIQGTVTDAQGAVVSGAALTLTNKETGRSAQATSNDAGIYNFSGLMPSHYSLTTEKAGFKKQTLEDLTVISEQANAVNVELTVGAATETMVVNGDATPLIDTATANISGTVNAKQIQALPSFGRDVFQLTQLAPGVFGDGAQAQGGGTNGQPGNQGPGGACATCGIGTTENRPQISANGGRQDSNNVTVDGIGITSVSWGGAAVITPNEDSVKEVKVLSNNYDAENGRFSGAQIQVVSQNGTNQPHGSLFIKADRPGLNAYQHWNGPADLPTSPQRNNSRFNDYGGSVGGPIWKNKIFAFFSYEAVVNGGVTNAQSWYETPTLFPSAPAGSIAAKYGAYPGMNVKFSNFEEQTCVSAGLVEGPNCHEIVGQGLDIGSPLTTALGTKDTTFVDNLNPGVGNGLDGVADIFNVKTVGPNNTTAKQYNGRLDFNATNSDLIAFSIYRAPNMSVSANGFRPANLFNHEATNEAETLLWNHTFSSSLLNEVRVNAAGWRYNELKSNPQLPEGLPQTAFIGDQAHGGQIGTIGVQGPGGAGTGIFDQWTYGLKDSLTKVHGSHTLKFGGEVTNLRFVQAAPWAARPNYGFNNYWDFLNDAPVRETGFFDPRTGIPTAVRKDSRSNLYALFFQDDYKFRPNLTLNFGLRWEYFGPLTFTHNQLATVVLGSGANALTDLSVRVGGNLYTSDKKNFGPQFGFAWSPHQFLGVDLADRLVIRGGAGIGYTGPEQAITLNGWPNVPFLGQFNLTGLNIVYAVPSNPKQLAPYPVNPNAVLTFNSKNLPTSGAPIGVTAYPAHEPTAYAYRYSFDVKYDLGHDWVATVGYQGSSSRHLGRQSNLNQIYGAQGIALNPVINDLDYYSQDANASSNALLAEIQHRFSRSFELDTQYRWASSKDDASGPYTVSNYQWNSKANNGASDYDVRHALKIWGVYSPTIFRGSKGWLEKVAGGWSVSGIFNVHTGFPWSPAYFSTCNLVYSGGSCTNGGQGQLLPASYLGGARLDYSNSRFLSAGGSFPNGGPAYFTPSAFTDCTAPFPATCPAPQQPGVRRNSFGGPGYIDLDATLSKSFGLPKLPVLGEAAKLELRANFFNLTNRLNLTNVDNTVTDPHFGEATGALGSRTIEVQARFNF